MSYNRKKILLVDDDPVNLKMARNTLMGFYDVFTVPSAEKMFIFLEKTLPDMILLDVLMPDINGYEAMRLMLNNEITKHIPVIFLTSKSDMGSEMEGLTLGAVDYIAKPFIPQLLLKRVETHMLMDAQKEELKYINANLERMVDEKTSAVTELQNAVLATVSELVECRDDVTGGHVERTSHTMRLLVKEMVANDIYAEELLSWDIELFLQSSQLHDVGKISIHDSILLKPGKLTNDEFDEMKKHAVFGEEIIDRIQRNTRENAFLTHAKIMAGTHHERWDGSGYPRGVSGRCIPLQGRIMAIADVYDALISKRPYKEPFSHKNALHIMCESKERQFDPVIMDAFVAVFKNAQHSA
ncbi:MAG: response regulator [Clostridiales Family XIII bacterium]|jgi:putative two-component system response regulator|nr:response regulator [Clostridiales Family XIII bacterium]